ncbi:MAG: ATP-binding protein [Sporichthyaceae bacterium]
MTVRFGPGSTTSFGRLRVLSHRASSATLSGAYPFLAPQPCRLGALVGADALTGEPFSFDPWALYAAGALTNPNVALAGVIGSGKSALAKSLVVRAIASGRRAYVPGDPKGEWSVVAEQVGGTVLRLGPGLPARLNPLDAGAGTSDVAGQRSRVLAAVAESLLGRDLSPGERAALDAAVASVDCRGSQPVVSDVVAALVDPDPAQAREDGVALADRVIDGRDVAHGLRRLVRGDLAGMVDARSTVTLDPDAPMVVVDLSALGSDDLAVAVAMTCVASWLEGALGTGTPGSSGAGGSSIGRWIVYDEAWRLLRSPALIRRMQAQLKLSRAHGIANLLVLHRLSDLDAVGAAGSEARALAAGLLADCSTRVIYRQETDQLSGTEIALGLTDTERALLPSLPRGCGLWKLPRASHLVHHRLHRDELALYDTDLAMCGMREPAPGGEGS